MDFSAKVTGSYDVDVKVKELVLSNVAGSGELTFTGGSPYFSWGSLSNPASYTLSRDDGGIVDAVLGTDVAALSTDPAGVLCLVPQTAAPRVKLLASFGSSDYEVRSDFPSYVWKPGGHYTYSFAINRDDYNLQESTVTNFSYTGEQQTFTVSEDGYYKLEAWGARGGSIYSTVKNGGGYTRGTIYLKKDQVLYVYVGGKGTTSSSDYSSGGWNGGGSGNKVTSTASTSGGSGGGATDFRLVPGDADTQWDKPVSLNSRFMVAGGGGGDASNDNYYGGCGGGLQGGDGLGDHGMGGTQTSGVIKSNVLTPAPAGSFGYGSDGAVGQNADSRGGGGSGYYGGSGGNNGSGGGGGGGSSFISGMTGCVAIDPTDITNQVTTITTDGTIYSRTQDGGTGIFKTRLNYYTTGFGTSHTWDNGEEIIFTNCSMIDGAGYQWNTGVKAGSAGTMPNPSGGTMTGNTDNGYARITQLK